MYVEERTRFFYMWVVWNICCTYDLINKGRGLQINTSHQLELIRECVHALSSQVLSVVFVREAGLVPALDLDLNEAARLHRLREQPLPVGPQPIYDVRSM